MSMHPSLKDKKFGTSRRSKGRIRHPGQAHASAKKRGASQEELIKLKEAAFGSRKIIEEDPERPEWSYDWDD